jgi:tetraacyldisaccharide 4'-kinase
LTRPVISVGNLRTGGSGKTPVVEHIARLLLARGERPAILTRGYARRAPSDGVTVVSDGTTVLAPLEQAGDEPLMLARALPGVPVLVGANRYLSGLLAEGRFGATIHLLDDGFQHVALARDLDLLIADARDLADRVLPAGHLRESLTAAGLADALLIADDDAEGDLRLRRELGIRTAFRVRRVLGTPRWIGSGDGADPAADEIVLAVAGIARPERFFADLTAAGWRVAGTEVFRDHHPYTDADAARIARAAHGVAATLVLTTEKDGVRLAARDLGDLRIAAVPLAVTIEPGSFVDWLAGQLQAKGHAGAQ